MMMVNVVYNKICKLLMMIKMEILKIKLIIDVLNYNNFHQNLYIFNSNYIYNNY